MKRADEIAEELALAASDMMAHHCEATEESMREALESWKRWKKEDTPTVPDFDPSDAPKGFVATLPKKGKILCQGCALEDVAYDDVCVRARCSPQSRKDKRHVIFARK